MAVLRMQARQRNLVEGIEIEEFLRHHQREVRRDETNVQHPRALVILPCGIGKPPLGLGRNAVVVDIVLGGSGADRIHHRMGALPEVGFTVAQSTPHHAIATVDVHRVVLMIEARWIFGISVVQLADRVDPMLLFCRACPQPSTRPS